MGRRKRKAPPFIMIRRDLLKDPQWRKLSSSAKVLYIYLRSKFNYRTLSEVSLAYSELKGMNRLSSTRAISNAFKELQREKWIEKAKIGGGMYGGVCTYKFIGPYKDFYYKGGTI